MRIRPAEPGDVEIVVHILDTSRHEFLPYARSPHTRDETVRWVGNTLIPSGGVVIAQESGKDVGVLATSVSGESGWIDQLYLLPGYTGQGIGTGLLDYAFEILPRPIRLWTFQQNDKAMRFYERHGFNAIEFTNGEGNEEQCPDVLYEFL